MRILIVTPRQPRTTGNWVAASRQQRGLEALGHTVRIVEADEAGCDLEAAADRFAPDVVNVLHAYRSGKPWLACGQAEYFPLVVTLTGTDVNHGLADPEQGATIRQVLARAQAVITINPLTHAALTGDYPEWAAKLHHVPPAANFGHESLDLRGRWKIPPNAVLFLHPAGIRPVKGNRELLRMFDRVARGRRSVLVFCGPVLDEDYGRLFFKDLRRRPWAIHAGEIPVDAMASVFRTADVVLNNSFSEGFSTVLHEAACLGVPILARNIPGNRVTFEPGRQGVLYHSPDDFVRKAIILAGHPQRRRRLSRPLSPPQSPRQEAEQLDQIFRRLTERPSAPRSLPFSGPVQARQSLRSSATH